MLLAIDEAQVLFDTSLYRTPDFVRVESYQLSMPLLALDLISGRTPLVRRQASHDLLARHWLTG